MVNDNEALPSWRPGASKAAIVEFIESVTRPGESYVPPEERIASFDNDGTLWCEKPQVVQVEMVFSRWKAMIASDPGLAKRQPYRAIAEDDQSWFADLYRHEAEILDAIAEAYEGYTVEAFEAAVEEFFHTAAHSTFNCPYTKVGYKPMRELLDLLQSHGFLVFICSGGGRDFIRPVSAQMYGIPRERVIGSAAVVQYRDGGLYHTKDMEQPFDDGPGKPAHIWMRTGRRPLLACGNANGDVPMLECARFGILMHHDDADREFAYDAGAEKALSEAGQRNWTVVSMKDDFATVFGD